MARNRETIPTIGERTSIFVGLTIERRNSCAGVWPLSYLDRSCELSVSFRRRTALSSRRRGGYVSGRSTKHAMIEKAPSNLSESLTASFASWRAYSDAQQSEGPSPAGLERYKTTCNWSDDRCLYRRVSACHQVTERGLNAPALVLPSTRSSPFRDFQAPSYQPHTLLLASSYSRP